MPPAQPPGPSSVAVSRTIRRLRIAQGLSAREMCARLAAHGLHLSQSSYGQVERAETRATVDILVAAALALDTSPAVLLMPGDAQTMAADQVEATGWSGAAKSLWDWLRAERPLTYSAHHAEDPEAADHAAEEWRVRRWAPALHDDLAAAWPYLGAEEQ